MKLALFPLKVFLLPEGITRLRIFEQRYLRMVKEASEKGTGFVLCHHHDKTYLNLPRFGCQSKIIDFNQDDTGQLIIDIYGEHLVSIDNASQENDGLRVGKVTPLILPLWQGHHDMEDALAKRLQAVFAATPILKEIYKTPVFSDPAWVARRWIEILPLPFSDKQDLAFHHNFEQVKNFLHTVVQ